MKILFQLKNYYKIFNIKTTAVVLMLILFALYACKRNVVNIQNENVFNTEFAKEWYYGVFKKTDEYKNSRESGKKLPDWKKANYLTLGNMEVIEFPLTKNSTKIPINSKGLNFEQVKQIANATLVKTAIIKYNEKIYVREINYIPDYAFLKSKNYDISDVTFGKKSNNFTGRIIIKNWSGNNHSTIFMQDGKVKNWLKNTAIKPNKKTKENVENTVGNTNTLNSQCEDLEMCEYERICRYIYESDVLVAEECDEWVNTGNCWPVPNPYCNDFGECVGDNLSETCLCMMFGLCGGGEPPVDDACNITQEEFDDFGNLFSIEDVDQITYTSGSEHYDENTQIFRRPSTPNWQFGRANIGRFGGVDLKAVFSGVVYQELEQGRITPRPENWKWESINFSRVTALTSIPCIDVIPESTCSVIVNNNNPRYAFAEINVTIKLKLTCPIGTAISNPQNITKATNNIDATKDN
jgi:hypothetical protein